MSEIIIDVVNIYECTYSTKGVDGCWYCEEHLYDDGSPVCKCKENKDCYYKQLKRLQTENEELKEEIKNWKNLKPIDVTEFCQTVDNAFNNTNKYKQALEEIRKLAVQNDVQRLVNKVFEVTDEVLKDERN